MFLLLIELLAIVFGLMLIKKLDNLDGIERFRVSSIEPNLLNNEILDFNYNFKYYTHSIYLT